MYKRLLKFGKWFAILYVAQALVGIIVGVYLALSGTSVFGYSVPM